MILAISCPRNYKEIYFGLLKAASLDCAINLKLLKLGKLSISQLEITGNDNSIKWILEWWE